MSLFLCCPRINSPRYAFSTVNFFRNAWNSILSWKNFMQFGVNRHFPSCTILPLWNWDWCKAFNININFAFFFQIWLHHMWKVIVMKARVFKLTMDLLFSYWYIAIFVYLCSKLIFCFLVSTTLISDRIKTCFQTVCNLSFFQLFSLEIKHYANS